MEEKEKRVKNNESINMNDDLFQVNIVWWTLGKTPTKKIKRSARLGGKGRGIKKV